MDTLEREVQQVFAELTRYPLDVLDPQADLEEELGIDSVKRAEILTAFGERYGLPQDLEVPVEELSTISSISRLIRSFQEGTSSGAAHAPSPLAQPVVAAPREPAAVEAAEPSPSPPAHEVGASALPPAGRDTATQRWILQSMIQALQDSLDRLDGPGGNGSPRQAPAPGPRPGGAPPTSGAPSETVKGSVAPEPGASRHAPPSEAGPQDREPLSVETDIEAVVLDTMAEVTRYPREILTLEADLEEDLGIDSVKLAEVAAVLGERLALPQADGGEELQIRTVGDLVETTSRLSQRHGDNGAEAVTAQADAGSASSAAGASSSHPAPAAVPLAETPSPAAPRPEPGPPVASWTDSGVRPFKDKLALVTGSGHGIGKTIALELSRLGATVVVNSFHSRDQGEATSREIESAGGEALHVWGSVAKAEHLERIFGEIEERFGYLDFYVANAGNGIIAPLDQVTVEHWEKAFRTNIVGLHQSALLAAPLLRRRGGGKIVTLSSPGAQRYIEFFGCLGPVKAAVESLTRYLAIELAPDNIQVNSVSAGPIYGELLSKYPDAQRLIPYWESLSAGNRLGEAQDVANFVSFLLSPAADKITGSVLLVDSGGSQRI